MMEVRQDEKMNGIWLPYGMLVSNSTGIDWPAQIQEPHFDDKPGPFVRRDLYRAAEKGEVT